MIDTARLGKILLLLALGLVCVSRAGVAGPDGELPWRLLAEGNFEQALATAQGQGGVLGAWIAAEAREELGRPAVPEESSSAAEAARLFLAKDYAEVLGALDGASGAGVEVDAVHLFLRRGQVFIELGRIAEADSVLTLGIDAAAEAGLTLSRCFGLIQRGRARLRLRQIDRPREDLDAAHEIALAQGLPRWAGDAAIARSVVDRLQMDLDGALAWREKALAYYRDAGHEAGQARALHYIGVVHLMQGRLTKALTGFQEALSLARSSGDAAVEGAVLGEMASANYLLGDFEAALEQYREAIRLVDNPWQQGMMLNNIGSIHEFRGEYAEARRILPQALALIRQAGDARNEATVLMSLGETLCELKEFTEGLANLDQALSLAREYEFPMTEAYALKSKGHGLLDSGDLQGAALALAEATEVARRIDYFEILEWSLLGQAMVARREGRLEDAWGHLREALAEVSEVRRRSAEASAVASGVTSQAFGIYAEALDVLFELHRQDPRRGLDQEAFAVAQGAKARIFLNLLAEAEFDLNASAVPGYRQQESGILIRIMGLEKDLEAARGLAPEDSIGSLRARLAAAEDDLQLLEARLRAEDPRYAEILYPQPLSMADLAGKVLRPGEIFLDYALGDSASYLWAITPAETRFVRLPPRPAITDQVTGLLPLLADYNLTAGDPAWFAPAAHALYRTLLGPVQDLVDAASRLIVSPDGILHYLPFEVLLPEAPAAARCGDLPFLVRSKVVSVTPSASVLARIRARLAVPPDAPWLLVGDPVLVRAEEANVMARAAGAGGLPPLPHVGEELDRLGSLAPGGRQTSLRGADATLGSVRAAAASGPHSLVHFATHGLFNESRPRYSGLVLSPAADGGDSGFLSVSEVFGLDLDCDQVVLSACASGLGQQISGEGLVGLTRSFMFAGARSVVAALWDVSGEATGRFMADFYRRLAAQEGTGTGLQPWLRSSAQ